MTKEEIQSFTYRITKANRTEMLVVLYDMACLYLRDAKTCLERDEKQSFRQEIGHARDVIRELMNSVNVDTKTGRDLLSLYIFYNEQLTGAYLDYDPGPLEHVSKMLSILSEGYREAAKKDMSGAVMGNTETVYSGLTYNRHLTGDTAVTGSQNRGFLA